MKKTKRTHNVISEWGEKVDWNRRVKAVCKPCWELKYCPYGPLVEAFPLRVERPDDRSCRIFGHDCPVFSVAEPLTETRELRNIGRTIPRPVQFRVLKRDHQICGRCQKPVLDGDIHFDHIIPWSKGGPTEEHNIRLLCGACNRKRGAAYEAEYLVESTRDHFMEPVDHKFVGYIWRFMSRVQEWRSGTDRMPDGKVIARLYGVRKTDHEDLMVRVFSDLHELFSGDRPTDLEAKTFDALKLRWGFRDGSTRKLRYVAKHLSIDLMSLAAVDIDVIRRLGWNVRSDQSQVEKWAKT